MTTVIAPTPGRAILGFAIANATDANGIVFMSWVDVSAAGAAPFARRLSHEGKTWIRGHHDENSEQGRALLAAYALTLGSMHT